MIDLTEEQLDGDGDGEISLDDLARLYEEGHDSEAIARSLQRFADSAAFDDDAESRAALARLEGAFADRIASQRPAALGGTPGTALAPALGWAVLALLGAALWWRSRRQTRRALGGFGGSARDAERVRAARLAKLGAAAAARLPLRLVVARRPSRLRLLQRTPPAPRLRRRLVRLQRRPPPPPRRRLLPLQKRRQRAQPLAQLPLPLRARLPGPAV